jgi:Cu(I)/Ag(I) efflux system membrane fusion protein
LKENYTGVLTINQEQIQTISARAMGRIEKLYFKTTGEYVKKNQAIYKLYSEDIAIAKQDFSTYAISHVHDFGKMPVCSSRQTKVTVLWLSNALN